MRPCPESNGRKTIPLWLLLLPVVLMVAMPAAGECAPALIVIHGQAIGGEADGLRVGIEVSPDPNMSPQRIVVAVGADGRFEGRVRFDTYRYSLLYEVCSRKPKKVTVVLCRNGTPLDNATLRVKKDFGHDEREGYSLWKEPTLRTDKSQEHLDALSESRYAAYCASEPPSVREPRRDDKYLLPG